jgi:hypothetical protein
MGLCDLHVHCRPRRGTPVKGGVIPLSLSRTASDAGLDAEELPEQAQFDIVGDLGVAAALHATVASPAASPGGQSGLTSVARTHTVNVSGLLSMLMTMNLMHNDSASVLAPAPAPSLPTPVPDPTEGMRRVAPAPLALSLLPTATTPGATDTRSAATTALDSHASTASTMLRGASPNPFRSFDTDGGGGSGVWPSGAHQQRDGGSVRLGSPAPPSYAVHDFPPRTTSERDAGRWRSSFVTAERLPSGLRQTFTSYGGSSPSCTGDTTGLPAPAPTPASARPPDSGMHASVNHVASSVSLVDDDGTSGVGLAAAAAVAAAAARAWAAAASEQQQRHSQHHRLAQRRSSGASAAPSWKAAGLAGSSADGTAAGFSTAAAGSGGGGGDGNGSLSGGGGGGSTLVSYDSGMSTPGGGAGTRKPSKAGYKLVASVYRGARVFR